MNSLTKTFTFKDLQSQVIDNFNKMTKVFYVDIERDYVWELYLDGFSEESRQEHNCNCCKSFLRQYSGAVSIVDSKVVSIWDNLEVSEEYQKPIDNLREYIHSRPVTNIFLTKEQDCGTKQNLDLKRGISWNHFYFKAPSSSVVPGADLETRKAQSRDDKNVLKRGLEELTLDATETVLELIAQNSLYRGKEFEAMLRKFHSIQKTFNSLPEDQRDNFCWVADAGSISRIRNTAIGTLLIDLSSGTDLEVAVGKFERMVAPTNYKRPTSLVTPKMVEQAKETLRELGLLESLERRYANEADIRISDIIFKDTPSPSLDVFDEVAKETLVNPKTLSKVEEMSIEDFLANVVLGAKSISVLVENSHLNNFVSLITAQDPETESLFKWGNSFSWSYTGGITDSIKERVKEAGGRVDGELRTSLSWFNFDDLDIHVVEPGGHRISFQDERSSTTGTLDVDMNAGSGRSRSPVENIIWTDKSKMKEGIYKVKVNNYSKRETKDSGYIIQIECQGQIFDFEFKANPATGKTDEVAEFSYSKEGGITFKGETKSNVVSKEKWGLKTNRFHKLSKLMLSPNYWRSSTGNKHYLFLLDGCRSDEAPRPFFNEFLKPELSEKHRKVFEILGSKVKIEDTDNQLSGLGFSETVRNRLIVQVEGKFKRTVKIRF